MCDAMGAQFFLAQTELLWGRMLVRRGGPDVEMARQLLERARDAATARGYASVQRSAEYALGLLDAETRPAG
jgi:hypothetical protein